MLDKDFGAYLIDGSDKLNDDYSRIITAKIYTIYKKMLRIIKENFHK
jgi:hypothetical protein